MHIPLFRDRRAAASSDSLPPHAPSERRERRRRGGPRTPLPLLPLIAICTGIGLAYVSQTAQATQANYDQTTLIHQQQQLTVQDQLLAAQLAQLSSAERLLASAQQLGMVSGGTWTYAVAPAEKVVATSPAREVSVPGVAPGGSVLGALSAALSGVFGAHG